MTPEDATRRLELAQARLSAVTRALYELHAEAEFAPPSPALSVALLNAKLALEQEGVVDTGPVPREELCPVSATCISRRGHAGQCKRVDARPVESSDFGPNAAKRRRY